MKIINWEKIDPTLKCQIFSRSVSSNTEDVASDVTNIIRRVRAEGDMALLDYTQRYDRVKLKSFKVSCESSQLGMQDIISPELKDAIENAYIRIKEFHELQKPSNVGYDRDGIKAWKSWLPIENVGLYIPGGTAPLISTLLMLAIPAKLAGCPNIVCVTPPNRDGGIDPAILYAAELCGIKYLYSIGGAQAIAALAYGTETVPKVDKIFGPGNKYVTEAKLQVARDPIGAALDMPAGPSEVLVIAGDGANPQIVASDLLAQAEHDQDAIAICITTNAKLAENINVAVAEQLQSLQRKAILNKSLKQAYIILAKDLNEAFAISNIYAPEHLIINIEDAQKYASYVKNSGSVFLGQWSAEALGDYASGPNHVLPTYGYARSFSGLGVDSFMKAITFQEVSESGLLELAKTVEPLAKFEGLEAHKMSVSIRRLLLERKL